MREAVEEQVVSLLKDISGHKKVRLDEWIMKQVGVYGSDSIELLDQLEIIYKVDLDPLVQSFVTYLPMRWVDRLLGRKHGPIYCDMKGNDLVDYIIEHAGTFDNPPHRG
jgi:hypothetical protein